MSTFCTFDTSDLDRAIIRHREQQTPESLAALLLAQREQVRVGVEEITVGYMTRQYRA